MKKLFSVLAIVSLLLAVFAVTASSQNAVVNGDIELGFHSVPDETGWIADNWTPFTAPDPSPEPPSVGKPQYAGMMRDDGTVDPSANDFQRIIGGQILESGFDGGIYQVVTVTPGQLYGLEADTTLSVIGNYVAGNPPWNKWGYDLTGQTTDPNAPTVVWVDWTSGRFRTQFTATDSSVSIWHRAGIAWAECTVNADGDNVVVQPETDPDIVITAEPTVTDVGPNYVTITWTTDVASTSRVNYGLTAPQVESLGLGQSFAPPGFSYPNSSENPELVTTHTVTISGLEPGTRYHFNVYSAGAAGRHAVWTKDAVFETTAVPQAVVQNGSFESGILTPWQYTYGSADGVIHEPWNFLGLTTPYGEYFLGQVSSWGVKRSVTSQQVVCQPSYYYIARGWIFNVSWHQGTQTPTNVRSLIGIDPNGNLNPGYNPSLPEDQRLAASTAVWSPWANGSTDGQWQEISVAAQAGPTASLLTVHLLMHTTNPCEWNIFGYDNVSLETAVPYSTIVEAKNGQENYPVILRDAIVTGVFNSDLGEGNFGQTCFTIEDPQRFIGVRVLSNIAVSVGDKVTINGSAITERGERVVRADSVTIESSNNAVPEAFTIAGIDTGGGAFGAQGAVVDDATVSPAKMSTVANNVGLLMKIRGKVRATYQPTPGTPSYNDYFYVDDAYGDPGLGFETGLKDGTQTDGVYNVGIKCRPATGMFNMPGDLPQVGDYVEVTGVMGVREMEGRLIRFFWTISWEPASFETYNGTRVNKWNLLSLPGMPKNPDPAYVFAIPPIVPDPDLIDGRLYRWDGPTQGLVAYDMWAPDIFGGVSSSVGYWLKASGAAAVSYEGYAESDLDQWIAAPTGWNIIGMPFTHSTQWGDWKATDGTATKSIYEACQYPGSADWLQSIGYWWDGNAQGMVDFGLEDDFPTTSQLDPWHGYWIKVKKNIALFAPAWSN